MFAYYNTRVTIELRDLVNSLDPLTGEPVNIWDFEYPSFYTGTDKTAFEQKVIDHYYFRQLGSETVGRWLHQFRARMREIMPYYIRLYQSQDLMDSIENPFGNVDITDTYTESTSDTQSGTSSATATGSNTDTVTGNENESQTDTRTVTNTGSNGSTRKFSNTPQGSIANLDSYLTEATVEQGTTGNTETTSDAITRERDTSQTATGSSSGTTASESESTGSGSKTYSLHREGNHGVNTYAHDMKEYRDIILNIDMQVIADLNDLFLKVY